jgi:ABC-type glycerol-3-phosphate transport system permease component
MNKDKVLKFLADHVYLILLLVLLIWSLFPILWSLSTSFKTPLEVYKVPPSLLPEDPNFSSYQKVFAYSGFWRFMLNSTILAVASTLLAVTVSILAGYAFARYTVKFRNLLLLAILIPRIFPRASLIIPLYRMAVSLGLLDTYFFLIITYAATAVPLATWILSGFFTTIPKALEEAASIDGAKPWQVILYVIVPLSLPGILTVSVFSLREAWNEFPFVLAFTTSSAMRTLPYQLYMLRDSMGIQDWPMLNAFTLVTILPILLLYLRFEKQVVSGIVSGAVK